MTLFPVLGSVDRSGISLHDMLFFDIETTGLSGGAGTYLFLAGFLRATESGFNLRQYLLHSPSSERIYLSEIGKELMTQDFLVSYNGKSYDYNILKNRYIMAGLPFFSEEHVHLDLLYTSRRIWRGLFPDYSLSTVERRALQVMRRDDIPGWQIPDVYAGYLRGRGVTGDMLRILRHNREDVLSLLALLVKQMKLIGETAESDMHESEAFNPITLSDMLLNGDKREQARTVLSVHSDSIEALKRLALMCKRELQFDEALKFLEDMCARSVGLEDYIFACTEAAKIYEHRLRDYHAALRSTERMLSRIERAGYLAVGPDTEQERARILHRWKRLKRKLALREN